MKNEKPSQKIDEVYALKSKSYIVITSDDKEECKHNGLDYNVTSNGF